MATNPSRSVGGSSSDDVKAEAKAKAADLKDKAQDEAKDRLAEGKSKATDALGDVAGALHDAGDALRDRDRDAFAHYAEAAADQVEQFTGAIRERSVGEILDEAERFARRDPGLFIGGAFLLGIFGARFLKASAPGGASGGGYARGYNGGSRSRGYDPNEPPYRVRNTAGGEMPDPTRSRSSAAPAGTAGSTTPRS